MDAERSLSRRKGGWSPTRLPVPTLLLPVFLALLPAGCQFGPGRLVPSPLLFQEQEQQILRVAPAGTPRDEAVRKLNEAGIEGSFGVSPSVYYCDIWNRRDGRRWHLDLALLFNESGELYEVRQATAETGVLSATKDTADTESTAEPPTRKAARGASEANEAASNQRASAREGRRTPFGEPSSGR